MSDVRTRFAPSPTGFLHLGGARTALYAYLYARKMQGKFILRIEDTDAERSTPESVQAILDAMTWLGLEHDEGPFYQTERFDRYRAVAQQLLAEGKAYRCYCSKARLAQLRDDQILKKIKPQYDGLCRGDTVNQDGPFVIRFKNPGQGSVKFVDMVKGPIEVQNRELDDLIIVRSDDWPTYNFTVVVDDLDMQISHVIRGDDHVNNTPRQINLFYALNAKPPIYGHLSTILGSDGTRLSKRHGAVSVMQYKDDGYMPHALINYLARLGWSHGDQEIFSMAQLQSLFDVAHINHAAAAFNPEKLLWLNQHYLKTDDAASVALALTPFMQALSLDITHGPDLRLVVGAMRDRAKTLVEMADKSRFFYAPITYNEKSVASHLSLESLPVLQQLALKLAELPTWDAEALHVAVSDVAQSLTLKLGKVAQPLRVAVTGDVISPSIDITLYLMGREKTLERLAAAIEMVQGGNSA